MENNNQEKIDVSEIFENALKDPELFSTLDIEQLLDSIENDKNDYLENKTMNLVTEDIFKLIINLKLQSKDVEEICQRLIGYRYVDEVHELHKGKHIRWIRHTNSKTPVTPSIKKNENLSHFSNGLVTDKNNFDDDNRPKIISGRCNSKNCLTNGGIVMDIKFLDNGTHVLCMNNMRRFIQYKFDECYTFQKLSTEEQLILMAYEHMEKK